MKHKRSFQFSPWSRARGLTAIDSLDRLRVKVSSSSMRRTVQESEQGAFAIWLDPFGKLDAEVVVNCRRSSVQVRISSEMAIGSGKRFMCDAQRFSQRVWWDRMRTLGRAYAPRPGKNTPKDGTHLPTACATPGHLGHFAALASEQLRKQPALRKGRSVFCHGVVVSVSNFGWTSRQ